MKFLVFILLSITSRALTDESSEFTTHSKSLEVPSNASSTLLRPNVRISGGSSSGNTQFPFVAELSIQVNGGGLLCTGSLIASDWILTARHCIADTNAVSVVASLGSADRQSYRVRIYADRFIWMNVNTGNHPDIALFHLASHAPSSSSIRPIRVPSLSQENFRFEGAHATAIGWGGVGGGQLSRYLQHAQFNVLSSSQCNLGENFICSQPPTGSTGASLEGGDSGGSLIITESGTPTLIGVNVVVVTGGGRRYQGSTRVSSFLRFIHDVTGIAYR